jgi:uncharacterized protein (TIGR02145 family)
MKTCSVFALLALLAISAVIDAQTPEPPTPSKRIALVIGNGNYTTSVLANPENDARAMAEVLTSVGFEVFKYENLTQPEMKRVMDDFGRKLKTREVGLFYYAGHGIQSKGINYLIPVNAELEIEQHIEYDCVQVDRVVAYMAAAGSAVNIIILDACRNNPFERSWSRNVDGKGLAHMDAPTGTLIAYATAPGSTASDGGGSNGLYTSAILDNIRKPDRTIIQMFQSVRSIVLEKSNGLQRPWESTSLIGDFYFTPPTGMVSEPEKYTLPVVKEPTITLPTIEILNVKDITTDRASVAGNILSDGGGQIVSRGFCWSTKPEPTTADPKSVDGTGPGSYSGKAEKLKPWTTYYVRAYAVNAAGTRYSDHLTFRTEPLRPTITTSEVGTVTSTTANVSANIVTNGAAVDERGFCWDTLPNPTIAGSRVPEGPGGGLFSTKITGLLTNTTYYLRGYSSNEIETNYGNEVSFKTLTINQITDIDGNIYHIMGLGGNIWMLENLRTTRYNDGSTIRNFTDNALWSQISPAYCYYDNNEANKDKYGLLYSWSAVATDKLCPAGWRIPTKEEWNTLVTVFGGPNFAGSKLRENKIIPVHSTTGEKYEIRGFGALPAGYRDEDGVFRRSGVAGYWWMDISARSTSLNYQVMNFGNTSPISAARSVINKQLGLSVRCVSR